MHRATTILVAAFLLLAPAASWAALTPYSQDFEGLTQADPSALDNDGWLVFGNVFDPGFNYLYGYGPFPAPNGGPAFSAIASGEGGVPQGAQQLSIYNDYNNTDHGAGNWVEANVFHEQTIAVTDVGSRWQFQFDAKLGNLTGASTARAFIKTLDPNNGFATTNFIQADMTAIPSTWGTYALAIGIDAGLKGQLLQFGFASTATNYEGSGVFYDNVSFGYAPPLPGVAPWGMAALMLMVAGVGTFVVRRRMSLA